MVCERKISIYIHINVSSCNFTWSDCHNFLRRNRINIEFCTFYFIVLLTHYSGEVWSDKTFENRFLLIIFFFFSKKQNKVFAVAKKIPRFLKTYQRNSLPSAQNNFCRNFNVALGKGTSLSNVGKMEKWNWWLKCVSKVITTKLNAYGYRLLVTKLIYSYLS